MYHRYLIMVGNQYVYKISAYRVELTDNIELARQYRYVHHAESSIRSHCGTYGAYRDDVTRFKVKTIKITLEEVE